MIVTAGKNVLNFLLLCLSVCPVAPVIPHASVAEEYKKPQYQQGDVIYYACETGYTSGPPIKYACTSEGWHVLRKGRCDCKLCRVTRFHVWLYLVQSLMNDAYVC